jgi:S-formylglutathione hydrolase FrmB
LPPSADLSPPRDEKRKEKKKKKKHRDVDNLLPPGADPAADLGLPPAADLGLPPAADASFYINSRDGKERYEDFLLQEFLPYIEQHYRARPGRANRAISGISMGGYGALHLAFRHPQLFGAVSAHSAALIDKLPAFLSGNGNAPAPGRALVPGRGRILGGVFGNPPDPSFWERNSPLALARSNSLAGLKIYFDCGSEDDFGFDAGAAALDKILRSRRISHEFHLYPGRHDWPYFASHLESSLSFHSRLFPTAPH